MTWPSSTGVRDCRHYAEGLLNAVQRSQCWFGIRWLVQPTALKGALEACFPHMKGEIASELSESIRGKPRHNNKKRVKDAQDACKKQVVCPSLDCSAVPRILDLCLRVMVVAVSGRSMTATASGT